MPILGERVSFVAEALTRLAESRRQFAKDYEEVLYQLTTATGFVVMCSPYNPRVTPLGGGAPDAAAAALSFYADVIFGLCCAYSFPAIDLRNVCRSPRHYANAIEPSVAGGLAIARVIIAVLNVHNFSDDRGRGVVYP